MQTLHSITWQFSFIDGSYIIDRGSLIVKFNQLARIVFFWSELARIVKAIKISRWALQLAENISTTVDFKEEELN